MFNKGSLRVYQGFIWGFLGFEKGFGKGPVRVRCWNKGTVKPRLAQKGKFPRIIPQLEFEPLTRFCTGSPKNSGQKSRLGTSKKFNALFSNLMLFTKTFIRYLCK